MQRIPRTFSLAAAYGSLLLLAIVVGGCASGRSAAGTTAQLSAIDEVAVVAVYGDITGETARNQIADYFGMELLSRGFTPVEPSEIQSRLRQQQFENAEATSTQGAIKAGKLLGVSAVVVAHIEYGEKMNMTAKMIEVANGHILWIGSGSGNTGNRLFGLFEVETTSSQDTQQGFFGGKTQAAGSHEGPITDTLSPEQCEMAKQVIARMCRSLPSRVVRQPATRN